MVESGVDCPEINARKDGVRNGPLFLITTLEVAISKHLLQLTPTKMKDDPTSQTASIVVSSKICFQNNFRMGS